MMAYDHLMGTLEYLNKFQGKEGVLHMNPMDAAGHTWGEAIETNLNSVFGVNKESDWANFDQKMGSDLDRLLLSIEKYWIDILAGILFFGGSILCLSKKSYG